MVPRLLVNKRYIARIYTGDYCRCRLIAISTVPSYKEKQDYVIYNLTLCEQQVSLISSYQLHEYYQIDSLSIITKYIIINST